MPNAAAIVGTLASGGGRVWTPCPREYAGNLCGVFLDGLPPVPGGAANPALVLSWFLDRYSLADQRRIRSAWAARGLRDVLVSWPDSRAAGATPASFAAFCRDLYQAGFEPNVYLLSKNYDALDSLADLQAKIRPIVAALTRQVGRWCVGWELSLWLTPADVQALIDWLAPQITPWGGRLYVHFQEGYFAFEPDGGVTADFWNACRGKLTGIQHQKVLTWDEGMYQARIVDCLDRFAGGFGFTPDSGFGHPFDFLALEITATYAFNNGLSETDQNHWARVAATTPPSHGPLGPVPVLGVGNGVA